jgi:hypothetical protein
LRAFCQIPLDEFVEKTEDSLKRLDYKFLRHGASRIVEFEITDPHYFRIVIESISDEGPQRFSILPPESKDFLAFELRFEGDHQIASPEESRAAARKFLASLIELLPRKPWDGLGPLRSRREKKKWLGIADSVDF